MRILRNGLAVTLAITISSLSAWAGPALYEFDSLFNQPHPFADGYYASRPVASPYGGARVTTPYQSYQLQPGQPAPARTVQVTPVSKSGTIIYSSPSQPLEPQVRSDWNIMVGAGAGYVPDYMGSDDYEVDYWPLVEIEWRDLVFLSAERGFGVNVINQQGFKVGPVVNYYQGRDSDGDISGLDDVDGGLDIGVFASYDFKPWRAELVAMQGVTGDNDGFRLTGEIFYTTKFFNTLDFKVGADMTLASDDYMDAFFGISAAESTLSGLAAYSAGWGLRDAGVSASLVYPVYGGFRLIGVAKYGYLFGEASDSPIVDTVGSAHQASVGLFAAYLF